MRMTHTRFINTHAGRMYCEVFSLENGEAEIEFNSTKNEDYAVQIFSVEGDDLIPRGTILSDTSMLGCPFHPASAGDDLNKLASITASRIESGK